jgi:hypothetical protein
MANRGCVGALRGGGVDHFQDSAKLEGCIQRLIPESSDMSIYSLDAVYPSIRPIDLQ